MNEGRKETKKEGLKEGRKARTNEPRKKLLLSVRILYTPFEIRLHLTLN
jgi:hypothetical protein